MKIMIEMMLHRILFCVAIRSRAQPTDSFTIHTPHIKKGCDRKFSFMPTWKVGCGTSPMLTYG